MGSDAIEILFQKQRLYGINAAQFFLIAVFEIKFLCHHYPYSATKSHRAARLIATQLNTHEKNCHIVTCYKVLYAHIFHCNVVMLKLNACICQITIYVQDQISIAVIAQ